MRRAPRACASGKRLFYVRTGRVCTGRVRTGRVRTGPTVIFRPCALRAQYVALRRVTSRYVVLRRDTSRYVVLRDFTSRFAACLRLVYIIYY